MSTKSKQNMSGLALVDLDEAAAGLDARDAAVVELVDEGVDLALRRLLDDLDKELAEVSGAVRAAVGHPPLRRSPKALEAV